MVLIRFYFRYWFLFIHCTWVMRSFLYYVILIWLFLYLRILCFNILWPLFDAFLLMLIWSHWFLLLCLIFVITSIIWLTFVLRSWDSASLAASIFYSTLFMSLKIRCLDRSLLISNWRLYLLPLNWFISFFEWV